MAVHTCVPVVNRDIQNNTVTYTGPGIQIAESLCDLAHGGQVVFGTDVYTYAMQAISSIDANCIESLGYKKEGVIPDYFTVYQVHNNFF